MCGIVGYIGPRDAAPILMQGLHRLEYRGYDSAGLVVARSGKLRMHKSKGKVRELESKLPEKLRGAPVSRTRAGRRTASRATATRIRTVTAPVVSRSFTTASSRTPHSCARSCKPAASRFNPTPTRKYSRI